MAEMSFGPKVFRSPVAPRNVEEDTSFLGLGQHLAFLQGCVAQRPGAPADMPIVVDFPDRPSKMLAAILPDYGSASLLKVSLVDLPKLPLGKLKSTEVVVEVHSASVNPTDCKQRKGTLSKLCALSLPAVLGIDFSGDSPLHNAHSLFKCKPTQKGAQAPATQTATFFCAMARCESMQVAEADGDADEEVSAKPLLTSETFTPYFSRTDRKDRSSR